MICLIALSFSAFAICFAPESNEAEQAGLGLDQIRARATQWRASFVNLRIEYDSRSLPATEGAVVDWAPLVADLESAPRFAQTEWIWADHGLDLYDDRGFYWTSGVLGFRHVDVFNCPASLAFRASYQKSTDGIEALKHLQIRGAGAGKPTSWMNRVPMTGLYWPGRVEWLPDILARREWTLEGVEPILGEPCAKIASHYLAGTHEFVDTFWLDLKHDCLPRRCRTQSGPSLNGGTDFVVDELQQLEGGLWFPKQARLQLRGKPNQNQLIVVTKAEINQSLDLPRFEPPPPENGTAVSDARTGVVYTHGVQSRPQEQASEPTPGADMSHLLSAVPAGSGMFWAALMICASLALFVMGLWLRKKEQI